MPRLLQAMLERCCLWIAWQTFFLELQEKKANNLNLVTATHFLPFILPALEKAKAKGLKIPVVYNTGGYEKTEIIKMLDGIVDIWLPDHKYRSSELSGKYSRAKITRKKQPQHWNR